MLDADEHGLPMIQSRSAPKIDCLEEVSVVKPSSIIPSDVIERRILLLRGQKVMLSVHLAGLYQVEHRALMQAVKRNIDRFPEDFMFQLNAEEFAALKSQIVTSSWGGMRIQTAR